MSEAVGRNEVEKRARSHESELQMEKAAAALAVGLAARDVVHLKYLEERIESLKSAEEVSAVLYSDELEYLPLAQFIIARTYEAAYRDASKQPRF